jgi:hypothetical protein
MSSIKLKIKIFFFTIKIRTTYILKRKFRRYLVKKLDLNRPANYPFISGDGFRGLATHILDELSSLDPSKVEAGDIVFINTDYLINFFKDIHPYIKNKYILITHNGDASITKEHLDYLDENVLHWFARNVLIENEKITPIPIGLINTASNKIGKTSDLPKIMSGNETKKKQNGISFGFSLLSGNKRVELHKTLNAHPFGFPVTEKNQSKYFERMNLYNFVASPEGNGPDCHRTWEALYLRCIPIVKRNAFIDYFKALGVPILTIDDWNEVESFDDKFLEETYQKMSHDFDHPALYMNYWIGRVLNERKKIF